ncbi:hypothetical protein Dimus_027142 [Dionaea muscipula]
MAGEEAVEASDVALGDHHKRKHEDLEQLEVPRPEQRHQVAELNSGADGEPTDKEPPTDDVADSSEAKRPRLDDEPDGFAAENGHQAEQSDDLAPENDEQMAAAGQQSEQQDDLAAENGEQMAAAGQQSEQQDDLAAEHGEQMAAAGRQSEQLVDENDEEIATADDQLEKDQVLSDKALDQVTEHQSSTEKEVNVDGQVSTGEDCLPNDSQLSMENAELENVEKPSQSMVRGEDVDVDAHPPEDFTHEHHYPTSGTETTSCKMEVPNNKVGVLIGKGGDTIRLLQHNSGAKIQITRDVEADPGSTTRPVELIGTLESIHKAEKLIKDVIAEADAGGSPSLVARGFTATVSVGAIEQVEIQVPNDKVGYIIGKGGETIKSLQTRSGARIQLIPQHAIDGDQLKGRIVRVSGDRKQIELARELIKEVMTQPMRSSHSSNYNQQSHRARGPAGTPQWGNRNTHADHQIPYEYQHRGNYPSQNQHYSPYGGYNPRSSYGSGWEQRPQQMHQGAPQAHTGGYNYYGGQGHGSASNVPVSSAHSNMGPPHSQGNYNYGKPRGPDYGHQPTQYSQTGTPHQQSYGQGYPEQSQVQNLQQQPSYGGHGTSQSGNYPDSTAHQGYGYGQPQQQFNRPAAPYGVQSQGAPPHSYAPPAAGQVGDVPHYQTPVSSMQPYAQNMPAQQAYPYASSGYSQSSYASAPAAATNDGYNQVLQLATAYPQQAYVHPVAQQTPAYHQTASGAGAYGQYPPTQQQGYGDQAAAYGYQQGQVDPAYAAGQVYNVGSTPVAPQGYAQPAPAAAAPASAQNLASYDQLGGYGGVPASANASATATVASSKSLSPQAQAQAQSQALAPGVQQQPQPQPQPGYAQAQAQYDSSQMYGGAH